MIYDLKDLREQNLEATEYGNPPSEVDQIHNKCLLAIAERLEALVDAQKPRWVEFELAGGGVKLHVAPSSIFKVYENDGEFNEGTTIVFGDILAPIAVKGTLAEVMAKIRGDK